MNNGQMEMIHTDFEKTVIQSDKIRVSDIIDYLLDIKEEHGDIPVALFNKTNIVNRPSWAKSVYTVTICNDSEEPYVLMDLR